MYYYKDLTFTITELDGEFFYASSTGAVNTNSLKAVIRRLRLSEDDSVRVFDPKNGVFSVVGEKAEFLSKLRMCKTNRDESQSYLPKEVK